MPKLTLNVSKPEFENRVVAALEGAMKSPLVKKKSQIVNAAMVQLLHGGNEDGKNEHNLDMFWDNSGENSTVSTWVCTENYHHEDNYDNDSSTFTGTSEDGVKRELYSNVCSYIADSTPYVIDMPILLERLEEINSGYGICFLENLDKSASECNEEDIAEFLQYACNEDLKTHEVIFDYITNLMCIEGSHTINEIEVKSEVKAEEPKQEPQSFTIHTIIVTHKAEGEDEGIDSVDVSTTISEEKHDNELLELFRSRVEENGSFDKDDLIRHSVTQEVLSDKQMDDEEIEDMSFEDIIDWLCDNGRPNMLTDMIPDATYGMISVEVQYEQETI